MRAQGLGITVSLDYSSAVAANRFGLGARPGELDLIGADARGWLEAQLRGTAPSLAATGLRSTADILTDASVIRQQIQAQRRAVQQQTTLPMTSGPSPPYGRWRLRFYRLSLGRKS